MPDYKKLYHKLFNDIADTIENLKKAQTDAEEMYLDMCEEEETKKVLKFVKKTDEEKNKIF